ncbi:hypothetical protein LUZ63_013412 [Rhynchospora breviuscula]|uniref:Uncharacterized protein n=1 Tax=Rhynchospora breviuscula TaxID=2022672 RepID=A0A9Q0C8P8_9POAL|nr:hypothetical protein LUZ63_013412 [Rhynchospora breviuscula]
MLVALSALFLSPFLILTHFNSHARAKMLFSNCSTDDLYAIGSPFESNLFKLLASLNRDALINGAFSNDSVGDSQDKIYGLVMCFQDSTLANCIDCLRDATSNMTQPCFNSATATVFYESCVLSYSRQDFFSVADHSINVKHCLYSGADVFNGRTKSLKSLRQALANASATTPHAPGMVSTSTAMVNGMEMTVLMQCTRDLSPQECEKCITYGMSRWENCTFNGTTVRMKLMERNCYIRYDLSNELHVSSFPERLVSSPPPLPPTPSLPPPIEGTSKGSKLNLAETISIVLVVVVAILAVFGFCFWRRKGSLRKHSNDDDNTMHPQENVETELEYILNPNAEYQVYNLTTLKIATDNFSDVNTLGKGGFGPVYKGTLPDSREIAVKRLSGSSVQGIREFKNEVDFLAKLKHKNLVQLLGCCITKQEKLLCYEYLPNGSLDKIIFANNAKRVDLGWKIRHKIIEGITRGLHYLHEESRLKIIHRDLKVSNILLDKDMNPKISDFGLARFFEEDQTHKDTSVIAGTFGYMAPEYILHGNFSAKSDVYSFGVLLLEIIIGQKNSSFSGSARMSNLIDHTMMHWKNGTISELKDPILEEEFIEEIKRCVHVALLCAQEDPVDRPNMETVKNMLGSPSIVIPDVPSPSTSSLNWLANSRIRDNASTTDSSTSGSQDGSCAIISPQE